MQFVQYDILMVQVITKFFLLMNLIKHSMLLILNNNIFI